MSPPSGSGRRGEGGSTTVIDGNTHLLQVATLAVPDKRTANRSNTMAKTAGRSANNIIASVRRETGKGASRRARRDGRVPAVLYGHGEDPQHLELDARLFSAVLRHSGTNAVLTLDIEGKEQLALTKALDIHPIRRSIQHADLLVVRRGEKVTVEVNVVVEGEATPGTLVTQESNSIEIEADVQAIPEQLSVSVEGADIGTQFTAGSITLPAGVSLVSDPETLVVNVVAAPTAEDLESEGAGEEAAAAEGEAAEEAGEESEGAPAEESE
jgi:large subunit ribosomal protein L25